MANRSGRQQNGLRWNLMCLLFKYYLKQVVCLFFNLAIEKRECYVLEVHLFCSTAGSSINPNTAATQPGRGDWYNVTCVLFLWKLYK